MGLLAPARGIPALPAKGRLSRPSALTHCGSHLGLSSHRTRKASLRNIARRKSDFLFQGVSVFFFAGIAFTTINYGSMSTKISIQPLHSPGKWKVVTPAGIARV